MAATETSHLTLQEKLLSETRRCPDCSFAVQNQFTERCPRCFAKLPLAPKACPGCLHRMTCPVAKK